jgi:hypothetical protein
MSRPSRNDGKTRKKHQEQRKKFDQAVEFRRELTRFLHGADHTSLRHGNEEHHIS